MPHSVKITSIEKLTHNVLKISTEKPKGFLYKVGQATDVSINKSGWKNELRSFTFTSLPEDNNLEFTIKIYSHYKGVTNQIGDLIVGDELILHEPFGDISYKGDGLFIAGGAGVTPFITILKQLEKENLISNNKLIFANKTKADIILEDKFKDLLGNNFINILSEEKLAGYEYGYISADLIKRHTDNTTNFFYVCGPEPFMASVENHLAVLGVENKRIVKEAF